MRRFLTLSIPFVSLLFILPCLVSANADLNGDGIVDVADLVFVASNFGRSDFNISADTNSDGAVNIFDVVYVASRFGTMSSAGVSYWPMDGNATDSWGNNDCALSGGPVFESGYYNQGLKLDGIDAYANCGNDASLEMGTSDWTITAWIKLSSVQSWGSGWLGIAEKGGTGTAIEGYWFNYYNVSGDLRLYVGNGSTREILDSENNLGLNDSTWHHVAVVFDRDDKAYFYLDGIKIGNESTLFNGQNITNHNYDFKIGYNGYLNGSVDEIKVYRRALTQQEIINVMNQTPPVPPVCSGTCKSSSCSSYTNCSVATGTCSSGYCCLGTCTMPPQCTETCKVNACNYYSDCAAASGACSSGYCCSGACTTPSGGREIYAASLSPADVQAAVNAANPGDTVVLPAGIYNTFGTTVYVPNGISMRGQGNNNSILKSSSSIYMFIWNNDRKSSSYRVEISDFQLIGFGGGIGNSGVGIRMNELKDVKVHGLEVRDFAGIGVYFVECRGVIYNSSFFDIYPQDLGQSGYCIAVAGDDVWDDPKPPLGTQEMVFIEDNYFSNCKHGVASNSDSKHVVRYNEFHNPLSNRDMVDEHGKQPQHNAGSNIWEIYENKIYGNSSVTYDGGMNARGGSGVIWNNKFYDLESPGSTPPHKAINMYLDEYGNYSTDYPNQYQIMDTYVWNNTLNNNPLNTVNVASAALDWIKEGRDYFMYQKPGYAPYPYPHPLRGT